MITTFETSMTLAQTTKNPLALLVDFPYQDMVHPARRDITMKRVVELAKRDATHFGMRVDSLESAQRVLQAASDYSEWNARSYRPALELIASALTAKQCETLQRSLGKSPSASAKRANRVRRNTRNDKQSLTQLRNPTSVNVHAVVPATAPQTSAPH
jgi:hypothetical protein